jgi:hypothetical protein
MPLNNKSLYKLHVTTKVYLSICDFESDQKNFSNDMKRYEMKPRSSKRPLSSLNPIHQPIWTNIKQNMCRHSGRIRWYSAEISKRLLSFTAFYSHAQNATVLNDIKEKTFHPIVSILSMNNFSLGSFTDFKYNYKYLILTFKCEFRFEIDKIQYCSYLVCRPNVVWPTEVEPTLYKWESIHLDQLLPKKC